MITAQNTITTEATFLFSCSDGKVMDDEGAEWVSEWYRVIGILGGWDQPNGFPQRRLRKSVNHVM